MGSKQPRKIEALVVRAIRRLQDVQGSSAKEISEYISQEYDVSNSGIRRQVQLALKRGVAYGILRKLKGGSYTYNPEFLRVEPRDRGDRTIDVPCPWKRRRGRGRGRSRRRARSRKSRARSHRRAAGKRGKSGRRRRRRRRRSRIRRRGKSVVEGIDQYPGLKQQTEPVKENGEEESTRSESSEDSTPVEHAQEQRRNENLS